MFSPHLFSFFFFFNDTATTEIYTLSLHDALPIYISTSGNSAVVTAQVETAFRLVKDDKGKWRIAEIRTGDRSEEHTSELQSHSDLVCRLLLEKKKKKKKCIQLKK